MPIDRRTLAPAPSDFSTALKALAMTLETDILGESVIVGCSASNKVDVAVEVVMDIGVGRG